MTWELAAAIGTTLAGLTAVLGAPWAIVSYWRSVRTRRAEWLTSLHEKFFETDRYANIRRVLDYRTEPEYSQLSTAVAAGSYHPLADELYRYLNFFELIASLRDLNQISEKEITALFDYDLRTLTNHSFVVTALGPQGFEKLPSLLKTIKPVIPN